MATTMIQTKPAQVIEGHYLDHRRLVDILQRIYGHTDGEDNFRVEVSSYKQS